MQKMIKIIIVSIFACIFFTNSAYALENLNFKGFISDNANILTENTENYLNSALDELKDKTKAEIAVVTLNSLNGRSVEETALQIFRKYKFGDKKLNNGALFLIAPNERKVRFEIGYGLEGTITDSYAGMILDDYVIPQLKKNDYEKGIIDGTIAIANDVAKSYGQTLSTSRPNIELQNYNSKEYTDIFHDGNLPISLKVLYGFLLLQLVFLIYLICRFIVYLIISLICFIIRKPVPDRFKISTNTSSGSRFGRSSSNSFGSSRSSFGGGRSGGGGSSRGW
jgi:uncharacterized protein